VADPVFDVVRIFSRDFEFYFLSGRASGRLDRFGWIKLYHTPRSVVQQSQMGGD